MSSVEDYVAETENLQGLQGQIHVCDQILSELEGILSKFETDLGKTTREIKELQDESVKMSNKVRNRREAETKLHNFIEQVTPNPALVQKIFSGEVDESYGMALRQLGRKLEFINKDPTASNAAGANNEIHVPLA